LPFPPKKERVAIDAAVRAIRRRVRRFPTVAIVLGSGLGEVLKDGGKVIPYTSIPHFPRSKVPGHAGVLEVGEVAVFRGRSHYYEGHSMADVVRPIRVLARLGVEIVVLTNAAGAANPAFRPGELMRIDDHINMMSGNPLRGENLEFLGTRFPDMTTTYDRQLRRLAMAASKAVRVPLRSGVYAAVGGPSYETPAEIRMLRRLGADVVGMSTVPEAIAARHAGMRVAAFSCITNLAAGLSRRALSHEEVIQTTKKASGALDRFLGEFLRRIR